MSPMSTGRETEVLPEPLTDKERDEIAKAVEAAKKSDVAVVVLGDSPNTVGETASRTSLDLPGRQLDLVQAVYATGKPVVVVLTEWPADEHQLDQQVRARNHRRHGFPARRAARRSPMSCSAITIRAAN